MAEEDYVKIADEAYELFENTEKDLNIHKHYCLIKLRRAINSILISILNNNKELINNLRVLRFNPDEIKIQFEMLLESNVDVSALNTLKSLIHKCDAISQKADFYKICEYL